MNNPQVNSYKNHLSTKRHFKAVPHFTQESFQII